MLQISLLCGVKSNHKFKIMTAITETEFVTPHEQGLARRRKRIKEKYLEYCKMYPNVGYSKLCAMIAESESELLDGVKSASGVIGILKFLKIL
jgi:hypothetical protein